MKKNGLINQRLSFILCFFITLCAVSLPAKTHARARAFKELLLKVELNHQEIETISLVLQGSSHHYFISQKDLSDWAIKTPALTPVLYKEQSYYPLDKMVGLSYQVNMAQMTLKITVLPELFKRQKYAVPEKTLKPIAPESIGGYLNYTLNVPPEKREFFVNGLFGAGLFGPVGVINSDFLANSSLFKRDVIGVEDSVSRANQGLIRLNSTWTIDKPETMLTLRFGDSLTQPGMWGNAVAFGGIQISTNFATQPRFITYPLPTIKGEAVMPSVVDLYIDNALIYQRRVPPGPFDINSLPVLTGQGQISLVSRDLLGRQQVIEMPYYASSNLLKAGLTDYSLEMGFVRNNFGLKSNDYRQFAASFTLRQGLSDVLTQEVHASLERKSQALGLGATRLVGQLGLVDGAIALSKTRQGFGGLVEIGLERNSRQFNFGADVTATTAKFEQLGQSYLLLPPKLQGTIFFGRPLAFDDSMGLSLVSQVNHSEPSLTLLSANYTRKLGPFWNVTASGLTNLSGVNTKGVFLTLTKRIGRDNTASINANQQNGANQVGVQFNHNAPTPNGWDYYASALPGKNGNLQGGVNKAFEFGDYSLQVANQNNKTSYTANASGSIAYFAGLWQFTKRITNSFGVVQVPGYDGIGVFLDNQLTAHTNKQGVAFIPDLRAYDDNKISIQASSLPMTARLQESELHAVPYYHSGVLMTFNVHPDNDALLTVKLPNGAYLPAGATIQVGDRKESFPVAYRGEVYLTGLKEKANELTARWQDKRCRFSVHYKQSDNPLPNLGIVTCKPF